MSRDELLAELLTERFGPRPRLVAEQRARPLPHPDAVPQQPQEWTELEQARHRRILNDALPDYTPHIPSRTVEAS